MKGRREEMRDEEETSESNKVKSFELIMSEAQLGGGEGAVAPPLDGQGRGGCNNVSKRSKIAQLQSDLS